ncbi:MAG: hypothetical protein AB1468_03075 [Candidatus Micrarchaeota archaeon]
MDKRLSASEAEKLIRALRATGRLTEIRENNPYLLYHGMLGNFGVRIYRKASGERTLTTNDEWTLERILARKPLDFPERKVIWIDDSGWGSGAGVLIGAYDEAQRKFLFEEVSAEYFKGASRESREYLRAVADAALNLVKRLGASKNEHVVKICSGYVNTAAAAALREKGFLVTMHEEVGEPLQSLLKDAHRKSTSRRATG